MLRVTIRTPEKTKATARALRGVKTERPRRRAATEATTGCT